MSTNESHTAHPESAASIEAAGLAGGQGGAQPQYLVAAVPPLHPCTLDLVERFAHALAEKLYAAEMKYGYSDGWLRNDWMDECRAKLVEHVAKGDPRDVAAYSAFLWHHGERTALPAHPENAPRRLTCIMCGGTTETCRCMASAHSESAAKHDAICKIGSRLDAANESLAQIATDLYQTLATTAHPESAASIEAPTGVPARAWTETERAKCSEAAREIADREEAASVDSAARQEAGNAEPHILAALSALGELERHHIEQNAARGRDPTRSKTLRLVREAQAALVTVPAPQPAPAAPAQEGADHPLYQSFADEVLDALWKLGGNGARAYQVALAWSEKLRATPTGGEAVVNRLLSALNSALGIGGEFPLRKEGDPPYWWRKWLQEAAGLQYDGERYVPIAAIASSGGKEEG